MDTKSLRQKILDLAIRGKLVPQDPNDEPASVLLERIRTEKQQMVKDGKLKAKDIKGDSVIFKGEDNLHYEKIGSEVKCIEAEIPFEIPDSWCWCRLESIIELTNGISKRRGTGGIDTIVLRLADLVEDTISFTQTRRINLIKKEIDQYSLQKNDLLFIRVNGSRLNVGKVFIFDSDSCVAYCDHLMRGKNRASDVSSTYIKHLFGATDIRKIVEDRIVSAAGQNTVSQTSLTNILIPMAPVNEQNKIVNAITLAFEQVSVIESEESDLQTIIAQAKSKILDLAIRGKLVLQDPADEPASVLLERIRAEKEQLIKVGKIKREKNESYIFRGDDKSYYEKVGDSVKNIDAEIMFEIPENWMWARLGACFNVVMGSSPSGNSITNNYDGMEFHQGKICFSQMWLQQSDMYTSEPSKVAPAESVLLCVRAPVGTVNITDREICIGRGLASISPACKMTSLFAYYWISTLQGDFIKKATGSTFIAIMADIVKEQLVPMPPLAEQLKIVDIIECLYKQSNAIMESL